MADNNETSRDDISHGSFVVPVRPYNEKAFMKTDSIWMSTTQA